MMTEKNILNEIWKYNYPTFIDKANMEYLGSIEDYIPQADVHQTNYAEDFHMRIPPAIPVKK